MTFLLFTLFQTISVSFQTLISSNPKFLSCVHFLTSRPLFPASPSLMFSTLSSPSLKGTCKQLFLRETSLACCIFQRGSYHKTGMSSDFQELLDKQRILCELSLCFILDLQILQRFFKGMCVNFKKMQNRNEMYLIAYILQNTFVQRFFLPTQGYIQVSQTVTYILISDGVC